MHYHSVHREVFVPVPPKLVWPILLDSVRASQSSADWPSEYQSLRTPAVAEGSLAKAVIETLLGTRIVT